jgi:hypothetical protein
MKEQLERNIIYNSMSVLLLPGLPILCLCTSKSKNCSKLHAGIEKFTPVQLSSWMGGHRVAFEVRYGVDIITACLEFFHVLLESAKRTY